MEDTSYRYLVQYTQRTYQFYSNRDIDKLSSEYAL
jgi:hypothetical protein